MTVNELIEKLKKFSPDGNAKVFTHYRDSEQGFNDGVDYVSMEEDEVDGKLIVVIHTSDNYY